MSIICHTDHPISEHTKIEGEGKKEECKWGGGRGGVLEWCHTNKFNLPTSNRLSASVEQVC